MYFNAMTGLTIDNSTASKKELGKQIDSDANLSVDFEELDDFFENKVDLNNGILKLSIPVTGVFKKPISASSEPVVA